MADVVDRGEPLRSVASRPRVPLCRVLMMEGAGTYPESLQTVMEALTGLS